MPVEVDLRLLKLDSVRRPYPKLRHNPKRTYDPCPAPPIISHRISIPLSNLRGLHTQPVVEPVQHNEDRLRPAQSLMRHAAHHDRTKPVHRHIQPRPMRRHISPRQYRPFNVHKTPVPPTETNVSRMRQCCKFRQIALLFFFGFVSINSFSTRTTKILRTHS